MNTLRWELRFVATEWPGYAFHLEGLTVESAARVAEAIALQYRLRTQLKIARKENT